MTRLLWAETVLVVVPDDKGITEGGKDPVVTTDGSVTVGLTNSRQSGYDHHRSYH